tara:strand:+ start:96 stop:548 length:453 start_codon:yes stop_codon:yes gene_type:complete
MAKVVKSISLDAETAVLAGAKDNFSAWVREQLYHEIILEKDCVFFRSQDPKKRWNPEKGIYERNNETREETCNGMRKPRCPKCYPDGAPTQEDWLEYVRWEITLEELLERTKRRYDAILAAKNSENDANTPPLRRRKYVRRFLSWVWEFI